MPAWGVALIAGGLLGVIVFWLLWALSRRS
jgi:hypothetical protein